MRRKMRLGVFWAINFRLNKDNIIISIGEIDIYWKNNM